MIHKKLLEFQKQQIVLQKKGNNPHFKSSYVTLNEVLESVVQPLNELGVVIIQTPSTEGLTTTLYDTTDDTFINSFLPYVEASTAQKLGSNNTYNRRYALVTMLGLGDNDDDGNEASKPKPPEAEPVKEDDIPDGTSIVTVLDEKSGEKNGRPWQRVKTGDGAAWNNDMGETVMEIGKSYEVTVRKGTISKAVEESL